MGSYTICVAETFEGDQWVPADTPDQWSGWCCPGEINIDWLKCHVPRYVVGPWNGAGSLQPDDLAASTAESALGCNYTVTAREELEAIQVADDDMRPGLDDIPDSGERWQHFLRDVAAGLASVDRSKRCRLVIWVD